MSELPQKWVECEMGDVAKVIGGGTPDSHEPENFSTEGGIPWLTPADLSDNKAIHVARGKRFLTKKGFDNSSARLVPKGTVLFSSRAPIGYVAVAANEISTNQGFKSFVCADGISSEYIYFWLRFATPMAEELASGTTFAEISGKNAAKIPLRLAPHAEQRRIVAKLEKLLGQVDASQQRLAKLPALLKRFRLSVLAAACSGRLTADWREQNPVPSSDGENGLPNGWQQTIVGDAIEGLKYGTSQKCSRKKQGVPVLRIPNIVDGAVSHSDLKYAALPEKESQQLRLRAGDILLIRSNGSVSLVGKCALVREADRDFAYAGYLIRLRPDANKVSPEFLNLVLGSYNIRKQIEIPARSTSGVNNINSEEVRALQFVLPPLAEQKEIVRRVEGLFLLADQIEVRLRAAQRQVDKLTPSLLARAFAGKLVPQDPNDESAAVLLERIRGSNASITRRSLANNRTRP